MQSKKIAITGGIGSGKSTVADIIRARGFVVYSCDEIYGELLKEKSFRQLIADNFDGVIDAEGNLDRGKLSATVFADQMRLDRLTELTNPPIMARALALMEKIGSVCFCEVPLLFENGYQNLFDGVIVILRGMEDRIRSVMQRSRLSRNNVVDRISHQFNYDNYSFEQYYVIHNNFNKDHLSRETNAVLDKITHRYGT